MQIIALAFLASLAAAPATLAPAGTPRAVVTNPSYQAGTVERGSKIEHAFTVRNDGSALQAGDLYFNTTDGALRAYSGTSWVAGTAGTLSVQNFSGNGSTTAFTLAAAPSGENNTQVYIDGVYQQKDQYSVSGTTLTFSSAPPASMASFGRAVVPEVVQSTATSSARVESTSASQAAGLAACAASPRRTRSAMASSRGSSCLRMPRGSQ